MKQGHSQNFEEHHILEYFSTKPNVKIMGTCLEIGANDAVTLSNTRALAELGWKTILVEPSPKAYARLLENCKDMPNVSHHQLAIITINENIVLFESGPLLGDSDVALVSSVLQDELARFPDVAHTKVMVKGVTWETFYESIGRPKIDFVSIDCEGLDMEILQQMNLEEIGARCVCVEWNLKEDVKKQFIDYMNGFKVIYTSAENLIFAK